MSSWRMLAVGADLCQRRVNRGPAWVSIARQSASLVVARPGSLLHWEPCSVAPWHC